MATGPWPWPHAAHGPGLGGPHSFQGWPQLQKVLSKGPGSHMQPKCLPPQPHSRQRPAPATPARSHSAACARCSQPQRSPEARLASHAPAATSQPSRGFLASTPGPWEAGRQPAMLLASPSCLDGAVGSSSGLPTRGPAAGQSSHADTPAGTHAARQPHRDQTGTRAPAARTTRTLLPRTRPVPVPSADPRVCVRGRCHVHA